MPITEPMTMATDFVMGGVAFALAVRMLHRHETAGQTAVRLWATAFVCVAFAAVTGGSYHGFIQMLPPELAVRLWTLTLAITGFGTAALLAAAVVAGTSGKVRRVLVWVVIAKLAAYLFWIWSHSAFIIVIVDYLSALAGVVLLARLARPSGLTRAAGWITAGAGVSVAAGLIQALRVAPHPQFNHNDLFHVIQTGAFYLLYRGGLQMRDMRQGPGV